MLPENWTKCVSLPIGVLFFSKCLQNTWMSSFVTRFTESLVSCNNFCNFLSALTFHAQFSLICPMRAPQTLGHAYGSSRIVV